MKKKDKELLEDLDFMINTLKEFMIKSKKEQAEIINKLEREKKKYE